MLCTWQGKLRLVSSHAAEGSLESDVLRLAAAVEGSTRHPLADAVLLAAHKAHLQVFTNHPTHIAVCSGMEAWFVCDSTHCHKL